MLSTVGIIYPIIIFVVILLFVVSFTFFIRKMLINSSARSSRPNKLEEKLDTLIEQNHKIISLLEKEKRN